MNWLAAPHAQTAKNKPLQIDLRTFTAGFNPDAAYTIDGVAQGTADIEPGQSTVLFRPEPDFTGIAELVFTVDDGDKMSGKVTILVTASD